MYSVFRDGPLYLELLNKDDGFNAYGGNRSFQECYQEELSIDTRISEKLN